MTKQTQDSMLLVGTISGAVFFLAFVLLMVVGGYTFSPALFLALAVGAVVAVFLFIAFHRKPEAPASTPVQRQAAPAPAPEPAAAPAPQAASAPAPQPAAAPAPQAAPASEPAAPEPVAEGAKPATLDAPKGGAADDLKKIKGVGPKLETMLHGMGFYHYDQIANWTPAEIAWVDENLEGFKGRVSRDNWVEQAKTLATGGETEFSQRVDEGDVY